MTIAKLNRRHEVDTFDCGKEPLNRFLVRYALTNQAAGASQTYVALNDATVLGYYTLVVGEVAYGQAAERLMKGLARHPVPVMILARLAIATTSQGQGLGAGLLRDAMLRTLEAADIAGIRAFVVHAKDDEAKSFYERFDFQSSPTDPYHMYLLLKDIAASGRA
ncbi:MAG: GNAT family N-acetyltransferase [Hyphomicrobium sp.]|nr:MAG: GNAT family N-acetyltransferase [Hyphomicrobium sp.]